METTPEAWAVLASKPANNTGLTGDDFYELICHYKAENAAVYVFFLHSHAAVTQCVKASYSGA